LKEAKAVPNIVKYASNKKERTRLRVMVALNDIKDTLGIPTLVQGLFDQSFLVKAGAGTSLALFGRPALVPLEAELDRSQKDEHRAILIKTIRAVYQSLGEPLKTEELKKRLAMEAKPYLSSGYPALHEQALKLVDEVEGRKVLTPEELFLYPER
jgi:HEAT repeat protein